MILHIQLQYRASEKLYDETASLYTASSAPRPEDPSGNGSAPGREGGSPAGGADTASERLLPETAPITVDFDALRAVNPDVIGWIWCEGTVINYPVLQAEDDDYYLHRSFDGSYNAAGSIFAEAMNGRDFQDANTILYGHHMRNGAMFAGLEDWQDPAFAAEHPVMWILTPRRDYKVYLISGYTTSALSTVYTVFPSAGEALDEYLAEALGNSDFSPAEVPEAEKYVVLSTCSYVFDYARYVIHGAMLPASSAGGVPTD